MANGERLEAAIVRLREVVAASGVGLADGDASRAKAARDVLHSVVRSAVAAETQKRNAHLEARIGEIASMLSDINKAVRNAEAPDAEAIGAKVLAELARDRRRRRAFIGLALIVLFAGAAGWHWGDSTDLQRVTAELGRQTRTVVEVARSWFEGL